MWYCINWPLQNICNYVYCLLQNIHFKWQWMYCCYYNLYCVSLAIITSTTDSHDQWCRLCSRAYRLITRFMLLVMVSVVYPSGAPGPSCFILCVTHLLSCVKCIRDWPVSYVWSWSSQSIDLIILFAPIGIVCVSKSLFFNIGQNVVCFVILNAVIHALCSRPFDNIWIYWYSFYVLLSKIDMKFLKLIIRYKVQIRTICWQIVF